MSQLDIIACTYRFRVNNRYGTVFVLEQNSFRYFITAKHIGCLITDHIELEWDNGWERIPTQVVGHSGDDITVAYCEQDFARWLYPEWTPPPILPDLKLGEDVRFYGFPHGMRTSRGASTVPIPLVKGGIISGFYDGNLSEDSSFWIDGYNNPGFAGGPVVSIRDGVYSVAGVISRYAPEPVREGSTHTPIDSILTNSGIIYAENIKGAMNIITR